MSTKPPESSLNCFIYVQLLLVSISEESSLVLKLLTFSLANSCLLLEFFSFLPKVELSSILVHVGKRVLYHRLVGLYSYRGFYLLLSILFNCQMLVRWVQISFVSLFRCLSIPCIMPVQQAPIIIY